MRLAEFLIETVPDIHVSKGTLHGIPIIEVRVGRFLNPWQIAEKWATVEKVMAEGRVAGLVGVETKREGNLFRSYSVHDKDADVSVGRM